MGVHHIPERHFDYRCGVCGQEKAKEELLAKRVTFAELGTNRVVRSRTTSWLCPGCREQDPAWTQPQYASPGMVDRG